MTINDYTQMSSFLQKNRISEDAVTRVSDPDPDPVGSDVFAGSRSVSGFKISLDPDPDIIKRIMCHKNLLYCLTLRM